MDRILIHDGEGGCIFVEERCDGVLLYLSDDPDQLNNPDLVPVMGLTGVAKGQLATVLTNY